MSRVMRISEGQSVGDRARQALWEVDRDGQLPQRWTLGRDVWNLLRRDVSPDMHMETFFGLPFTVKGDVPPDLLELDAF